MGNIASKLPNPPNKYRPIPFWSWNERLNEAETRRQIDEMEKAGIGGYFMHARGGLQTPYMQQEWMDNIRAGIEEARERGMGAWAYDENGWPSGFGNGIINGRGEVWQQKYLRYEVVEKNTEGEDGRTIANVTLGDGRILHFYYDVNPFYVDTLDRAVTAAFLEEIYQPYYELFQNDMGRAMPGFFTDEPQVSRNGIPWSLMMIDEYRKTFDEDLVPALPGLFLEVEGYQRTRHRFWWLVQELFVMNFTQQIYDWCEAHGAQLTGHMVLEETLHSQITSNAAVMPHYEFFHMPGMDWLGRSINPITTPLQVASVSHQLGRRQILSETFALTGWNVTFEELKWMFDWQCVRGVTSLCQHLQGYSLRGIRKRDYPPSFFYHEPWWPDFRHFTDMVSRLGMLLAKGDVRYDVLMLHPQQSAWLHYDNEENPGLKELSQSFMAVGQALEAEHVLFHYGDERILRRHGLVEGAKLVVGTQSYSTVVVPPIETLEPSTVALLSAFADGGGQIIWVEQLPTMVNAEPSEALKALTAHGKRVDLTDLNAALASLRVVSIATADGVEIAPITYTKRCVGDFNDQGAAVIYFFANADTEHDYAARIRMQGGSAVRIVLEDGTLEPITWHTEGDQLVIEHTFPRRGSLCVAVFTSAAAAPSAEKAKPLQALPADLFAGKWQLELLDPNSLTLDYCDIWFDGELIAEHESVSVVQGRALALGRPVEIKLRYQVQVAEGFTPPGDLWLVVEQPEKLRVSINDKAISQREEGFYRDSAFRKLNISGLLQPGVNEIVLETRFEQSAKVYENLKRAQVFEAEKNKLTYDSEIEASYLVGNFAVATPGNFERLKLNAWRYTGDLVLAPLPESAEITDLTIQGLPFFNGKVRLTKTVNLAANELAARAFCYSEQRAQITKLCVNGQSVKTWLWRPYCADVSAYLKEGENSFSITLTSGLRNLLGPHHLEQGESYVVHPGLFFKEPNIWGYSAWNEGYCVMPFGLELEPQP